MKRFPSIILLISILAAGCSPASIFGTDEAEPRLSPSFQEFTVPPNFIPRTIILTALGDSLSQGVGDEEGRGGYVGRLASELGTWPGVEGVVVENTAKRGRRSDQLLTMFQQGELTGPVTEADMLVLTMGGNDIMRIVKRDLFSLQEEAFYEGLILYETRRRNILTAVRSLNPTAPLVLLGLYNPFSLITTEIDEFDNIMSAYNDSMEALAEDDPQACFVPVEDLFEGSGTLVYHTDFFHPNSTGYDLTSARIVERMDECGFRYAE